MKIELQTIRQNLLILSGATGSWIKGGQFGWEEAFRIGSPELVRQCLDALVAEGVLVRSISRKFGTERQVWTLPSN